MNGADDVAGSPPSFRIISDTSDPEGVPQRTTLTDESETVIATKIQCGPYMSLSADHKAITNKPTAARMAPSASPGDNDGFFYDVLRLPDGNSQCIKLRSAVGLCSAMCSDGL
jgi:hypothetical protein